MHVYVYTHIKKDSDDATTKSLKATMLSGFTNFQNTLALH